MFRIIIIWFCILLVGCTTNENKNMEESAPKEEHLYDIYFIKKAPRAKEKNDLSDLIKIVFAKNDSSVGDTIAIDVKNNTIHLEPWMSSHGINSMGESEPINDFDEVIKIIEKHDVQNWKEDYSFEDPSTYEDGYAWSLYLQFEDGTVERHKGTGSFAEEITPAHFETFYHDLNDFVEERLSNKEVN